MRSPVYLSPAVYAQAVRDAEQFAASRGMDIAALHARQEKAMARDKADTGDDAPFVDKPLAQFGDYIVPRHVRTYIVRLWVGDDVYEYRADGSDPADAAKAARRLHADKGLPSSTAWRARLA